MQVMALFSVSLRNEEGEDRGERQILLLVCQLLSDPLVRRRCTIQDSKCIRGSKVIRSGSAVLLKAARGCCTSA